MIEAGVRDSGHTFIMLRPPEDAQMPDENIRNHYFGYYPGDNFGSTTNEVRVLETVIIR